MRLICSLLLLFANARAAGRPVNFIVMLVDDMGAANLGCTGSTYYKTPHIDQLAKDGVMFTHACSACTVCSPTRCALLTGKYPARTRITDWIAGHGRPHAKLLPPDWCKELPAAETTLPELLKTRGYVTGTFGKWHLGKEPPTVHGFDVNLGGYHRGQPETWFSPFKNPALPDGPDGEFLTERLTSEVEKFIAENRDRPFFVYFPHYAVHTPLGGKQDVIAKYKTAVQPGNPQRNPTYASMVESVDDSVGRLRAKLTELDLASRTVIIFTSDNGGLLPITSNLKLRAGKGSAYEGGVRVPLIIHWPGIEKNRDTVHLPVITMDLCATIAAATGLTPHADGRDLRACITGDRIPDRPLFWHYPHYHPGGAAPYSAVLFRDWRLIRFHEDNHTELYDLIKDPLEKNNLAAAEKEQQATLGALLDAWLKETGAQMPVPNPAYDAAKDAKKLCLVSRICG